MSNDTFDSGRVIRPVGLKDVDVAFKDWFDKKLNIQLPDKDGTKKKVPVVFVSSERWFISREEGIRDANGTIILPIITLSRTETNSSPTGPFARIFADNKQPYTYARRISDKSSVIANLNQARPNSIDPNSPVYEIYTVPPPDWYQLTYQVRIWTSYMDDMNKIIETIGREMDYNSVKSFQLETPDGYYYTAFQDETMTDDSNLDDFSGEERIIRKELSYQVPAYVIAETNQKKSPFKRYYSQTKMVINERIGDLSELLKNKK